MCFSCVTSALGLFCPRPDELIVEATGDVQYEGVTETSWIWFRPGRA